MSNLVLFKLTFVNSKKNQLHTIFFIYCLIKVKFTLKLTFEKKNQALYSFFASGSGTSCCNLHIVDKFSFRV